MNLRDGMRFVGVGWSGRDDSHRECRGQRSNGVRHGKGAKSKKLLLSRLYRGHGILCGEGKVPLPLKSALSGT